MITFQNWSHSAFVGNELSKWISLDFATVWGWEIFLYEDIKRTESIENIWKCHLYENIFLLFRSDRVVIARTFLWCGVHDEFYRWVNCTWMNVAKWKSFIDSQNGCTFLKRLWEPIISTDKTSPKKTIWFWISHSVIDVILLCIIDVRNRSLHENEYSCYWINNVYPKCM
jgi:hypothetical protein